MEPYAFGNTGYVYRGDDPRRFILERAQAAPISIPPTFRTDTSAMGVYMQGQIPDCVENGVTFAKRYFDWKSDGVNTDRSRRFLAILTAKDDGFPLSEGTNLTNALKRAMRTGICESTLLADDHTLDLNTFVSAPITQDMLDNAKTSVIQSYAYLSDTSLQGLKNAIYQNGLVILALKLDKNWWTAPNGAISWAKSDLLTDLGHLRPPTDPASTGGHVCVAVGYTENGIIIQNSFGETWCDNGFAMLGADYTRYIYEAATIIDMTPEQYRNLQADQIVNTVDQLTTVQNPSNASVIAGIIKELWIRFLYLFNPSPIAGGVPRSPQWSAVRAKFLKDNPTCAACGSDKFIQCHHVIAYHTHPELELDPSNFLPLCEGMERNCHRFIGHLDNFQSINENSRQDAALWIKRIQNRPKWDGTKWNYPVDNAIGTISQPQ